MNTTLLLQQITVAILVSAVVIPTVQRVKGWFPNSTWVEVFSAILAVALGILMSRYYASYDWVACAWVGFYSLIGAEAIYRLLGEKMTTFADKKDIWNLQETDPDELAFLSADESEDSPHDENQ
jgi:hypothetical protein